MMKSALAIGLLALAVSSGAPAQTQRYEVTVSPTTESSGYDKIHLSKATIGTAQIRLWSNTSVEPDCSPHGDPTLKIVHPPEHGTLTIDDQPFFFAFPTNGPRAACSQHKVPGHQAFYTAQAGYTGRDKVVLEGSQPDGFVRRIAVDIDVR